MDLHDVFVENWLYKLTALILSVLVWWSVTADQERPDQPIRTHLEVGLADTAWAVRGAPPTVQTIFEGRRGDLLVLDEPVIRKTIEEIGDSVVTLELSPQEVTYDRALDVRPTSVRPSRVLIELERRTQRMLPIEPVIDMTVGEGYARGRTILVPDSVMVSGPASLVEALSSVRTQALDLSDQEQTVTHELALELPGGRTGLRADRSAVLVTIELDSLVQREWRVPVRPRGPFAAGTTVEPATVAVALSGPSRALASLTTDDVTAWVEPEQRIDAPARLPVAVDLPEDLTATPLIDPARVTVRPSR